MPLIESGTPMREESTSLREFVRTSDEECQSKWSTWPKMQERAIENGTVLVWNLGDSVGHFLRTLVYILPVSEGLPALQ